jgi:uncharacterized protein
MPIDHLTPPTGQMADNVVGFARALRAAGMPVGPGAIIDALTALRLIEIGNRGEVFTTLESIFVKRHEHALIFAQAFDLFFRAAEDWCRCRITPGRSRRRRRGGYRRRCRRLR